MINRMLVFTDRLGPVQRNLLAFLILTVTIALLYLPTVDFLYCIDDQYYLWMYIEDGSSRLEYLNSLRQRFWFQQYRPVTFASILLEASLWGKDPTVHHFFNVVYYIVLCYLIYHLSSKFFSRYDKRYYVLALFIAFLFAMHPSHANIVPSIKNREVILSLSFAILSMLSWWRFIDVGKYAYLVLSAVLLMLGVLAKSDVLSFIFIIPLSGYLYSGRFKVVWNVLAVFVLLGVILISYNLLLNRFADPVESQFSMSFIENPLVAVEMTGQKWAAFSLYILTVYEKFMVWPRGYFFYFGYDQLKIVDYWNTRTILSLFGHLLMLAILVRWIMKKKFQYVLGPVIFFLSIAPFCIKIVAGIVSVRYSFIASLGFCMVLAQCFLFLFRVVKSKWLRPFVVIPMLAMFVIFSWHARTRSYDWKSLYSLYAADMPSLRKSVNANRMAGLYYYLEAKKMPDSPERTALLEKSLKHADRALSVHAPVGIVLDFKAKSLALLDRSEEASATLEKLVALDRTNVSNLNTAAYYAKQIGNYEESIGYFKELEELEPTDVQVYIELTQLLIYFERYREALQLNNRLFNKEYRYDALLNVGDVYIASGDTTNALIFYDRALMFNEDDYIVEEVLRISEAVGNDTMISKMTMMLMN